ncbi:hypothetical protein [Thermococcus indicus]|nr:hypothetical protein [Thermococcus indicus]
MKAEERLEGRKLNEFRRDLELAFGIFEKEISAESLRRKWDRKR